jgi:hypothetical protein
MLPTKFGSFGQADSEEKIWKDLSKECTFCYDPLPKWPPQAILVSDWPIFKNLLL